MIKMKILKSYLFFFLIFVGLACSYWGCAAAVVGGAAGAGAVLYSQGELKTTENAKLDEVYDAILNAMDDLDLDVISKDKDGLSGKIVAKAENGDNIDIKLEQLPNDITEMKIRVGAFGNEDRARLIEQKIRERLS
jgi:hypothetical protein